MLGGLCSEPVCLVWTRRPFNRTLNYVCFPTHHTNGRFHRVRYMFRARVPVGDFDYLNR